MSVLHTCRCSFPIVHVENQHINSLRWSLECTDRKRCGIQKRGDAMCVWDKCDRLGSKQLETGTLQPRRLQGTKPGKFPNGHYAQRDSVDVCMSICDGDAGYNCFILESWTFSLPVLETSARFLPLKFHYIVLLDLFTILSDISIVVTRLRLGWAWTWGSSFEICAARLRNKKLLEGW